MSEKTNDGGPAFPLATSSGSNEAVNGMSLRDWFAGNYQVWRDAQGKMLGFDENALALLTGIPIPTQTVDESPAVFQARNLRWKIEVEAAIRYMQADAMLRRRID